MRNGHRRHSERSETTGRGESAAPVTRRAVRSGLARRLAPHLRDLIRQAVPVVLARSGVMLLALVDTIVVGRFAADELAVLGLALTLVTVLLLVGIGLMMGTLVVTATEFGAGRFAACGVVWRRSLVYAVGLGVVMAAVCGFGAPILRALGQSADLAQRAGPVVQVLGLGLAPQLIFVTTQYFLEGIRRPAVGMLLMLAANALNAALDIILVFGYLGAPALGALGSAWATTTVRLFLAVGAVVWVAVMADRRRFFPRPGQATDAPPASLQRQLGYASGVSIGIEGAAFNGLGLIAGWLGALPLAAFTIGLNLIAFIFMLPVGIGAATAVQVGAATGRGDDADAALAGWTGLGVCALAMLLVAAAFEALAPQIATLYTTEPALRRVLAPVFSVLTLVIIVDGGQGVLANAVRGRGDTWAATALNGLGFIVVMLPAAWLLAVEFNRGVPGLFEAALIGCAVAVVALAGRFHVLTRGEGEGGASDGGSV